MEKLTLSPNDLTNLKELFQENYLIIKQTKEALLSLGIEFTKKEIYLSSQLALIKEKKYGEKYVYIYKYDN